MPAVVTFADALRRRQALTVDDYTETDSDENYYVTRYLGALPANVDPNPSAEAQVSPQAYYIEQPPKATIPAHYHDTNQFQVFTRGRGIFGKKPVAALAVHYASGHTPYGPIITADREIHYLTLRNRWDSGGKTMPDSRPTLRRLPRRFRMVEDFDLPELDTLRAGTVARDEPLPCADDGLGVGVIAMGAGASDGLALSRSGAGRYAFVLAGALDSGGGEVSPGGCIYIGPAEAVSCAARGAGAVVLVMQFPPEPC